MQTYDEFVAQAQSAKLRLEATDRPRITVGIDTSSVPLGARETLAALSDEIQRLALDVEVGQTGGNGLPFANPTVLLARPDGAQVLFKQVSAADAAEFIETTLVRDDLNNRWLLGALASPEGLTLRSMNEYPWWAIQQRRLMQGAVAGDRHTKHFAGLGPETSGMSSSRRTSHARER